MKARNMTTNLLKHAFRGNFVDLSNFDCSAFVIFIQSYDMFQFYTGYRTIIDLWLNLVTSETRFESDNEKYIKSCYSVNSCLGTIFAQQLPFVGFVA